MPWAALVALAVAALAIGVLRLRRRAVALETRLDEASRDLESLQRAFTRFAPAEVVERIIAQGVSTNSEKKEITVLFADLKGFTPLAERLDPALLVQVLNVYFERMSRAIDGHRGHVAKFIGGGILALFGALLMNARRSAANELLDLHSTIIAQLCTARELAPLKQLTSGVNASRRDQADNECAVEFGERLSHLHP